MDRNKVGAVLVVGGGIAGIQASLDLAESGFKVYLLEKEPSIGGHMPKLDKTFPTNDCAMCILAPKLVECGRHPNIELITYAELEGVEGEAGSFRVAVAKHPKYVDWNKCTGCGTCAEKCPVKVPNEYDIGLSQRKAIYVKYPQAVPLKYVIDENQCLRLAQGKKCGLCEKFCEAKAVDFEDKQETVNINIGSIILAPGFDNFDPRLKYEYGYGRYKNVVTSLEFERILSASGPFEGHLQRLSDGREPERIAFIQCVGSRDAQVDSGYCSSVCCTYAIKEAIIAREHSKRGLTTTIFYIDIRTFGKGFEAYYNRARSEYGVEFVRARVTGIKELNDSNNLLLRYLDESGKISEGEFDLVILSVGLRPKKEMEPLAERLRIELSDSGFLETDLFSPCKTSRDGVFVAGAAQSPKDIPETVAQASAAVCETAGLLGEARGSLIVRKEYLPEIDVTGQEPRVGIFICHCGVNIAGVVDVEAVERYSLSLPGVVYSERNLFTCSQDTQERIKETIREYRLNRVVVASCSPRTHESLFQETLREAGLNPYLFEMANIRDQCSWVHRDQPVEATEKAKTLVRMAVAKVRLQEPLARQVFPVTKKGFVIGGGLTGIGSSLALAEQGFFVYLVEKEEELGGNLRQTYLTLNGEDPQGLLSSMLEKVENHPNIEVYKSSNIVEVSGYAGNFKTTIQLPTPNSQLRTPNSPPAKELVRRAGELRTPNSELRTLELEHGVIIVATGAKEYKPTEYLYGQDERIITQRELEERIVNLKSQISNLKSVIMIQCVGSREKDRPYCSRICCSQAIKNGLKIKELSPKTDVYILYRDIRTYGFKEAYYTKAREEGIIFIRFDEDEKPEVRIQKTEFRAQNTEIKNLKSKIENSLEVEIFDPIINEKLVLNPDLVVLSAAVIPSEENVELSKALKLTLDENGFFMEAHPKLRPLDFASDGIFLAGLCHSPKLIEESILQAKGAAGRATTLLCKDELEAEGVVSSVDPDRCVACLTCIRTCPYRVPFINDEGLAEIEAVMCHGCGICAGECPARTIQLKNFTDAQILAKTRALMDEVNYAQSG